MTHLYKKHKIKCISFKFNIIDDKIILNLLYFISKFLYNTISQISQVNQS